jgi:hypothetical protein
MITRESIEEKIDVLIRQLKKCGGEVYIDWIKKLQNDIFSNDDKVREITLKQVTSRSNFLNIRVWDDLGIGPGVENPLYPTYYKDSFVDDFNNFSEFYEFLEGLVKDIEEYHKIRNT